MYLSKVILEPPELHNAWQWHRAIWSLFPEQPDGSSLPCLYRVEKIDLKQGIEILMQSQLEPLIQTPKAKVIAYKEVQLNFKKGQQLRFYLQTNTTKCIKDENNLKRRIRVPLIKEDQQQTWIIRQLEQSAYIKKQQLKISNLPPTYFKKEKKGGKIVKTNFTGILEVKSPEKLEEQLNKGIGRAKSFGCGLLSLALYY